MKKFTLADINHKAAVMHCSEENEVNILKEDVCLPVAVVKQAALDNNIQWMQNYSDACHVYLAPHGKTTMTPAIFKRQVTGGAWAIGVGTAYQAKIAAEAGVKRIIIANQVIGKSNMAAISIIKNHSNAIIYCCVDSIENARQLSRHFSEQGQTMDVLLEFGVPGGRCGCRTTEDADTLAREINALPALKLAGIEFYEGVIHSADTHADLEIITSFLNRIFDFVQHLITQKILPEKDDILLTGAGSVWYDIVGQRMQSATLPENVRYAIRPGCYITHDKGVYQEAQEQLRQRDALACHLGGDLASALELCAYVQSLPEPGLAIMGFGKRDVAFDTGLPQAMAHYRHGEKQSFIPGSMTTVDIMDQHAMVHYTADAQLNVGDIIVFSTSHPCITFDKWKKLYLVDGQYNVLETMDTCF